MSDAKDVLDDWVHLVKNSTVKQVKYVYNQIYVVCSGDNWLLDAVFLVLCKILRVVYHSNTVIGFLIIIAIALLQWSLIGENN